VMRLRQVGSVTLASLFFAIAVTPLFGVELLPVGRDATAAANVTADNLYLFVACSATFANLATFCIFYLRRRRPLSSVAPLLYFCFWCFIFAPAYISAYSQLQPTDILVLAFLLALTGVFFRENQREAKIVFSNEW
jgi:hypothetical protein